MSLTSIGVGTGCHAGPWSFSAAAVGAQRALAPVRCRPQVARAPPGSIGWTDPRAQSAAGVAEITAISLMAEIGYLARFSHPRELMGYLGFVPSEHSSGERTNRGSTTKTGNAHARELRCGPNAALVPTKRQGRNLLSSGLPRHVARTSATSLEPPFPHRSAVSTGNDSRDLSGGRLGHRRSQMHANG